MSVTDEDDQETKQAKQKICGNILNILKEQYGIEEEDFLSAEIEAVPAGAARDYGFDRSMIMGYVTMTVSAPILLLRQCWSWMCRKTAVCLLVDKEEIGSVGATGMQSRFFENITAEVMNACGDYSELKLRRGLQNSKVLSL